MSDADSHPDETSPGAAGQEPEAVDPDLQDVLSLMAEEVERLKESLEYYRLTDHPDKEARIRWHVDEIDRRQDALEDLKALILQTSDDSEH